MKNKTKIITTVAFGVLGLSISVVPFFQNEKITETDGYSGNSCPTTIKLKAPEESKIRNYYSDLLSLDVSEKQGTNLLKNLKPILMEDQKYYNYDSGSTVWQMYEITDRDWEKSPADQIPSGYGTYNSVTETITNYVYGSSISSKGSNPYIHALYVNRDYSGGNGARAWDSHGKRENMWTIEREHIWAKANGFDTSGAAGARGDPMHLWAANGTANGSHSNNYFGYVDTTKDYTDNGKTHDNIKGNLSGISKTKGSGTVFEPQDCDKGDIARAIFYMSARYNAYAGSNSDSFNTNNPNLILVDESTHPSSGYTSSGTNPGKMGVLSDLLEWNRLDPPDAYEINRNNLLYTNFTNNRNPFIDFPQWADYIWGTHGANDYAKPNSDSLNTFGGGGLPVEVEVTGVSLIASANISVNGTVSLTPSYTPSNTTQKGVTWSSSNTSVATVNNGVVTGVAAGEATITATSTYNNSLKATCIVTVTEEQTSEDTQTITINYDDAFDPALPESYSNLNPVTTHTVDNFEFKQLGLYKNTSTYMMFKENVGYLYNTNDLGTIESVKVTFDSVLAKAARAGVYFGNEEQSTYTTTSQINPNRETFTQTWTNTTEGNGYFQFATSGGNTRVLQIEIKYHPYLKSIELIDQKTDFYQNDEFDFDGTVIASFGGADDKDVTSEVEISSIDMSTIGTQELTVSYTFNGVTKTDSVDIEINEYNAIISVSLSASNLRIDLKDNDKTAQLGAVVEKVGSQAATTVTWESSDEDVATVSSSGLVTAKSVGTATITATSTYDTSMSATCAVTVVDTSVQSDEITDVLTRATTGITGTNYSSWSGKTASSNAIYAGQSAGGNSSIQLRSSNNNSGVITTTSGGNAKTIVVSWNSNTNNSRIINIYGSTTAYSNPTELYDNSTCGTLLGTLKYGSTSFTVTGDYQYIGIRSASGALYLESISITWTVNGSSGGGDTPPTPTPTPDPSIGPSANNSPYINGAAYKLFLTYSNNPYYFTGSMGGYYGNTSTTYNDGVCVYFEDNGSGQNLYFKDGGAKKYIYIVLSGTHVNFTIGTIDQITGVWKYDSSKEMIYMTVDGNDYTIGNYGNHSNFGGLTCSKYDEETDYKPEFQETAETFSYYLYNKMTCDASGETSPIFDENYTWSKLSTLALKLDMLDGDADTEVNKLESANYESPTTIVDFGIQRYRYLVWKYGYTDFLNLGVTPRTEMMNYTPIAEDYTTIILIISLVSISGLGLLLIRKKKHN